MAGSDAPGGTMPMRVVVIDDHRTFCELLSGALDREPALICVGKAFGVVKGVELCATLKPDLVVLDYRLPDGNGLDAAARILENAPDTRILMLTGEPTAAAIQRAATLGICGFLPKDGELGVLLEVIRGMRIGEFVLAPSLISRTGVLAPGPADGSPALTARELEVLRLMALGFDVASNARTLGISAHTCRGYVKSILGKLNAHSQLEAVAAANRLGMLGSV